MKASEPSVDELKLIQVHESASHQLSFHESVRTFQGKLFIAASNEIKRQQAEIAALRAKLAKADALAKACVFYKGIRWTPSVPPDLWMQVERALEAYQSEAAPTPAATVSADEQSFSCFRCNDGYTPLYCLNCAKVELAKESGDNSLLNECLSLAEAFEDTDGAKPVDLILRLRIAIKARKEAK